MVAVPRGDSAGREGESPGVWEPVGGCEGVWVCTGHLKASPGSWGDGEGLQLSPASAPPSRRIPKGKSSGCQYCDQHLGLWSQRKDRLQYSLCLYGRDLSKAESPYLQNRESCGEDSRSCVKGPVTQACLAHSQSSAHAKSYLVATPPCPLYSILLRAGLVKSQIVPHPVPFCDVSGAPSRTLDRTACRRAEGWQRPQQPYSTRLTPAHSQQH